MGINYLALNDLFQISKRRKDIIHYDIHVQIVEIYNEQVRDLLVQDSSTTKYPFILVILSHFKHLIHSKEKLATFILGILNNSQIRDPELHW